MGDILIGKRKFLMAFGLAVLSFLFYIVSLVYHVEDSHLAVIMGSVYAGLGAIGGLYFKFNVDAKKSRSGDDKGA